MNYLEKFFVHVYCQYNLDVTFIINTISDIEDAMSFIHHMFI